MLHGCGGSFRPTYAHHVTKFPPFNRTLLAPVTGLFNVEKSWLGQSERQVMLCYKISQLHFCGFLVTVPLSLLFKGAFL